MRRQAISGLAILIGIYLIISLSSDLQRLLSARERIEKEEREVSELESEQQELASELEKVMSEEFVEREAREKLLMSKPGEMVVLLPPEGKVDEVEKVEEVVEVESLANWEKWVRLFL